MRPMVTMQGDVCEIQASYVKIGGGWEGHPDRGGLRVELVEREVGLPRATNRLHHLLLLVARAQRVLCHTGVRTHSE